VLLHGVLGSGGMWRRVVPLVARHHDTIAPTALGHRGGHEAKVRPASIAHVVDDAERLLDELRLETAHLAGNSMGGWVALELARRGRARTVCAFSPAGCWPDHAVGGGRATRLLRATVRDTRHGRPILPLLVRFARFRRWAMRLNAVHGERLHPAEIVELADDLLGCTVSEDLLSTTESLALLDPAPCPITVAWSEKDRILRLDVDGAHARELVPSARFIVLNDVGHVPMFDAPDIVAQTVLDTTRVKSEDARA
jgi:pimeloyl-ACP methyl ester carboxylesterase